MSIKKRLVAGAAATAIAVGGLTMVAAPAHAIDRAPCDSHYLNLVSSQTTCWGGAGYASVQLFGVYHIISGNNAGYIQSNLGTTYFAKWGSQGVSTRTVSGIRIY